MEVTKPIRRTGQIYRHEAVIETRVPRSASDPLVRSSSPPTGILLGQGFYAFSETALGKSGPCWGS